VYAFIRLDHGNEPASIYGVKRARVDDMVNVQFSASGYPTFSNARATLRPNNYCFTTSSLGHGALSNAGVSTSLPGLASAGGTFGRTWMTDMPASTPGILNYART
jgi:hypothetical protein